MTKEPAILLLPCLLIALGCPTRQSVDLARTERTTRMSSYMSPPNPAAVASAVPSRVLPPTRFIAFQEKLAVETSESELPKAWGSAIESCRTLRCVLLASTITTKTDFGPPSGGVSLRIAPEDLTGLVASLEKTATIVEHTTQSEDKSSTVVDTEAEIKNLTEFRDRLRSMLVRSPGSLKDLVEVSRELSRVQTELDSAVAKRKLLTNETEKVTVEIAFRTRSVVPGAGALAPFARAWDRVILDFTESLATLLSVVVSLIPWLILAVPLWPLRKRIRNPFRRKTVPAPISNSL